MLKLYNFDRSPFAWKTRLVLAEKNIPYDAITPQNKDQDPAFAMLNPFRLTPVLLLEDGKAIYESTVIAEYLEETHPNPPMLPRDPWERARVRMLEDTCDQYFYPAIRGLVMSQFEYAPPLLIRRKPDLVDHKLLEESRGKVQQHLARLEEALAGKPWFGGEIFSLADAALTAPMMGNLKLLGVVPDPKYPGLAAWMMRLAARPCFKAAAPKEPLSIKER